LLRDRSSGGTETCAFGPAFTLASPHKAEVFEVHTPEGSQRYDAVDAEYRIGDQNGVLEVWKKNTPEKIAYSPTAWLRVEKYTLEWDPPGPE
jgi:hypothetical protein